MPSNRSGQLDIIIREVALHIDGRKHTLANDLI